MDGADTRDIRLKVGVSSCLLGEKVRWNGEHSQDRYLSDILGRYFEWVPVCPEVEVGMGVPRETVRLSGSLQSPTMLGTKSDSDWTDRMNRYSDRRSRQLSKEDLCGYIFKKNSPSCGLYRISVFQKSGIPLRNGRGLFADAFVRQHPLVPVEEEGRLNNPQLRENFIVSVFSFCRLQSLFSENFSIHSLVVFHTRHKYLLLAHSPKHYALLGRLVAGAKKQTPAALKEEYGRLFMEAIRTPSTSRKNVNVLNHLFSFLKKLLTPPEKKDILGTIDDYHRELVPLIVPLTLLKHYIGKHQISYLLDQIYLSPHPKELMLRNHV